MILLVTSLLVRGVDDFGKCRDQWHTLPNQAVNSMSIVTKLAEEEKDRTQACWGLTFCPELRQARLPETAFGAALSPASCPWLPSLKSGLNIFSVQDCSVQELRHNPRRNILRSVQIQQSAISFCTNSKNNHCNIADLLPMLKAPVRLKLLSPYIRHNYEIIIKLINVINIFKYSSKFLTGVWPCWIFFWSQYTIKIVWSW